MWPAPAERFAVLLDGAGLLAVSAYVHDTSIERFAVARDGLFECFHRPGTAPALQRIARTDPTGVAPASRHLGKSVIRRVQLPIFISAPTFQGIIGKNCAGVEVPRSYGVESSCRRIGLSLVVSAPAGQGSARPDGAGDQRQLELPAHCLNKNVTLSK